MSDQASFARETACDPDDRQETPFESAAEGVSEQAGASHGSGFGADDHPYDPGKYWDIYGGTD
ncbi:MAG: hypothetical protein IPM60_00385 [Rhodospirillales bacterium]|nr:hypothetical protein [Rhodospirillales bacterium]